MGPGSSSKPKKSALRRKSRPERKVEPEISSKRASSDETDVEAGPSGSQEVRSTPERQRGKTTVEFEEDDNQVIMEAEEGDASFLPESDSDEEDGRASKSSNNNAVCTPVSTCKSLDSEEGQVYEEPDTPPLVKKARKGYKKVKVVEKEANSSINEQEREDIINEMLRRFQAQLAKTPSAARSSANADLGNPRGTSAGPSAYKIPSEERRGNSEDSNVSTKGKREQTQHNPDLGNDSETTIYQNAVQQVTSNSRNSSSSEEYANTSRETAEEGDDNVDVTVQRFIADIRETKQR